MPEVRAVVAAVTILDAMRDPALFGRWFEGETWRAWRAFLAALFALPMDEDAAALYRAHTGRNAPPRQPAREGWVIVGRRGGKSRIAALVAVYCSCFRDYTGVLAPGEVGTFAVVAADRRQARTILRYVNGFLDTVPMLSRMVVSRTAESITLSKRVVIEVHTASWRTLRGYTLVGFVGDEISFWRNEGEGAANPDSEILSGVRPGMATVPGAVLLAISSPYARRGALWDAYRKHFAQAGDPVLVWQGSTVDMNPGVDAQIIADAYADDESAASAEYGGQFRRDIESFVSREAVEAVVVPDRHMLPPSQWEQHVAFVDPSGGSQDSMTLAVAHRHGYKGVLDCVHEWRAPFSPAKVVKEIALVLAEYGIRKVVGDRYGGQFVQELFRREHGITYTPAEQSKSELYGELLPLLNSGRVELLDHPRLIAQLLALDRRTARGGKDSIDHPPGGHDDVINAAAGALVACKVPGIPQSREVKRRYQDIAGMLHRW
jgi:hypothetical protein